jgi:hypothetical protein
MRECAFVSKGIIVVGPSAEESHFNDWCQVANYPNAHEGLDTDPSEDWSLP